MIPAQPEFQTKWLDAWSIVHTGVGVLSGALGASLWSYLPISIVYEIVERPLELKENNPFFSAGPEVVPNAIMDVLVGLGGYFIGKRYLK